MSFQKFIENVSEEIQKVLAEDQKVEIQQVRKNNDVLLHGLTIFSKECNVTPTIYLEPFYQLYKKNMPLKNIIEKILTVYQESMPKECINMDFFMDFEKVKGRIAYKLIHADRNKELLQDIPYLPFWDLAICFYYAFESAELGDGTILIHNNHMEKWNVTYRQLMQIAEENTPRLFPTRFYGMNEVLKQMHADIDFCDNQEEQLYVLTNKQKIYGASVILYPHTLCNIAEKLKSDFYILPSSVHEVLILKAEQMEDKQSQGSKFHEMIRDINEEQLCAEEVLSDYPYFYDRTEKKLTQIY